MNRKDTYIPCNKKILHIVPDDKFIDAACQSFESILPQGNEYICIVKQKPFTYIKSPLVEAMSRKLIFTRYFINYLKNFKAVIFHSFSSYIDFYIAIVSPSQTKLLWIGWGFDYYDLICSFEALLKLETLNLFKSKKKTNAIPLPKHIYSKIMNIIANKLIKKAAIRRINLFSPVIHEDYKLIKEKKPWIKSTFIAWNYMIPMDILDSMSVRGNNILIGNSASYTNNHLDIFKALSHYHLGDRKIVCPLNYGDKEYGNYIINKGREYFGVNFEPIIDFLPIEQYKKIVETCSFVFMNHLRQQAVGNIYMALISGAKVFLDSKNPFFTHCQKTGLRVFSINTLSDSDFSPLPKEIADSNRDLLLRRLNKEVMLQKTKNVIVKLLRDE